MATYSWKKKLAEGKAGADALATWLQARGHTVQDVQDDPTWQKLDTDFIVDGETVEVKTDARAQRNLFLEHEGLHKSTAEWWFFYVPSKHVVFRFPRASLADWLDENSDCLKWSTVRTRQGSGRWEVHGAAVPMRRLYKEVPCDIYRIEEKAA